MARVPTSDPDMLEDLEAETAPAKPVERKGKSAHAPLAPGDGWDELTLEPHDRHVYRASGIGGDTAVLVAHALGIEDAGMPASLQPYLDEGTDSEVSILEQFYGEQTGMRRATYTELVVLKSEGVIAGYHAATQQVEVRLEIGSTAAIVGHTDDIVRINPNGDTPSYGVVEAKAFGGSNWSNWHKSKRDTAALLALHPRYAWQVSALMAATGLPVYFVVGEKIASGSAQKGDRVFEGIRQVDITMFVTPPFPEAKLKARILKAEALVKKGTVPECDEAHWPCPYYREDFCLGKPDADEVVFTDVDDTDLGRLLSLHYAYGVDMSLNDDQKEAKKLREEVKTQIDKLMESKGYGRKEKMRVWSDTGDEFEFEWVEREVKARGASVQSFPQIKLVGAQEGYTP